MSKSTRKVCQDVDFCRTLQNPCWTVQSQHDTTGEVQIYIGHNLLMVQTVYAFFSPTILLCR
jgi:hypothetical protein